MIDRSDVLKHVILQSIAVVWRQGGLDRLGEFWAEDGVNHAAPDGQQHGLEALRRYHEGFGTSCSRSPKPAAS